MTVKDEMKKAGIVVLPPASLEIPESEIIIQRLEALGYTFRLNLCTDTVEVNNRPLSDITAAKIRMQLRDIGMGKKIKAAEDAYVAEAEKNAYHPVHDYLNGTVWDGVNYIAQLVDCLISDDAPITYHDGSICALHGVYVYRWLIGAAAKALDGKQNLLLGLDGPQGIGKSTLARYFCKNLPRYYIEGPIKVDDKDSDMRLMGKFIWEVSELGATTRKADVEALKDFITRGEVTVRRAYGRYDITKPAQASFIGTVNNTAGFLADSSGSRRFNITHLTRIDPRYQQIDVDQIWAQAVHLYRTGEKWILSGEEADAQKDANKKYEVESVLDDYLEKHFVFDAEEDTPFSSADILDALALSDIRLNGTSRMQASELSHALLGHGAQRVHTRVGKRWIGLRRIPR